MKKRILCAILSSVIVVVVMASCGNKDNKNKETVTEKESATEAVTKIETIKKTEDVIKSTEKKEKIDASNMTDIKVGVEKYISDGDSICGIFDFNDKIYILGKSLDNNNMDCLVKWDVNGATKVKEFEPVTAWYWFYPGVGEFITCEKDNNGKNYYVYDIETFNVKEKLQNLQTEERKYTKGKELKLGSSICAQLPPGSFEGAYKEYLERKANSINSIPRNTGLTDGKGLDIALSIRVYIG